MVTRTPRPIEQEIRQTQPVRSPAHEAVLGLARTADVIRRHFVGVLQPFGITPQQYNVLRILRGAGKAGHPTLEIAERMIEQQPGITRLLDRIEAQGWVRRERCAEDRRQVLCYITAAGLKLLQRLDEPVRQADERVMGGLNTAEQRQLAQLLDGVRAGLREAGTGN